MLSDNLLIKENLFMGQRIPVLSSLFGTVLAKSTSVSSMIGELSVSRYSTVLCTLSYVNVR